MRLFRHGRVKLPTTLCYEALRPRPKSWDRTLSLAEMDRGDHLQAPRELLGHASVAAAPLMRDGRPVAVRAALDAVLYADLKAAPVRQLERSVAALESQVKPSGPGASGELRARIAAAKEFIKVNKRALQKEAETELLREVHNPQVWRVEVPEGRTGGDTLSVKMWTGHYGSVLALCFSPDGKYLASSSTDGRAIVWSCPNYTQRTICVCAGRVDALCWVSPSILVTNSPGHAAKLPELMVGGGSDAAEGCVQLWYIMKGGESNPRPLCVIRHEGGGNVGAMAGWSPPPPPPWMRKKMKKQGAAAAAADRANRNLELLVTAAGTSHSSLRVWRPSVDDPNEPPRALGALHGHDDAVTDAAFSADGCFLATASADQTVLVWDVSTLRKDDPDSYHAPWCCRQLKGHTARACSVSWAQSPPDPEEEGQDYMPRVLVSGSIDKAVRVWIVFAAPDSGRPAKQVHEKKDAQMRLSTSAWMEPEPEPEPQMEPAPGLELLESEAGALTSAAKSDTAGPALAAALISLLQVAPRDRRTALATPQIAAAVHLLAADIRRGQTGVQDIPPATDLDGLRSLVWKLVAQTRKCASVLRKAERAERSTELSGLRLSKDVLGLWRCWLPLARKLWRWLRMRATWGTLPLVVGVGGAVGCGKTTAIQIFRLVLDRVLREDSEDAPPKDATGVLPNQWDSRPLRVLQVNMDEMAADQMAWWAPAMRNEHLSGIFGREGRGVLDNFAGMLDAGTGHSTDPDIVFVEGWRVGIDHPHYQTINRRLDRLLFFNGPLQVISTVNKRRAKQGVAELQTLKQDYFADRRWVLGDGKLAYGRVDWTDSSNLTPFGMELRVDRRGTIKGMSTTFPEAEYLQVGVLKGKAYPKKLDVTVGLGGDPDERNERRYRGEIDDSFYFTGMIETKREKRVIRRGEFEGQFMRKLIGGGLAPVRTESDIELINKDVNIGDLMDALAAFGKRPSNQDKWPLDSADEKMWEKTVRELALKRRIVEPSRTVDPKTRLDEMVALAQQRGLPDKLQRPPKEATKSSAKKEAMIGRLQFHALTQAMASVEISFPEFLEMVMGFDRTAYEMRDRRIFDHLRTIAERPMVPVAEFAEAVHRALTVNPPDTSGLLQTVAYEREGGIDAVFSDYYRQVAVPRWLLPVQRRADTVVHYDEAFRACHLAQRDGEHFGAVTALAWSPRAYRFCNGAYTIATASADGTVRLWRAERGGVCEVPLRGHSKRVTSVTFAPGGGELISGSVDGTVRIWWVGPIGGRRRPTVLGHTAAVEAVAASPEGGMCAATDTDFVMVWKLQALTALGHEWEQLRTEEQRAAAELGIAESQWARRGDSEGRSRLICESVRGLHGTTGRRWMAAARRLGGLEHVLRTGSGHGAVLSLSWSQSGQLVGGCEGNTVLIWRTVVATEPNEGDALPPVPEHEQLVVAAVLRFPLMGPVRCVVSFCVDGALRVAAAAGRTIAVWDAVRHAGCVWDNKKDGSVRPSHHAEIDWEGVRVTSLALADDGQQLMAGTESGLEIWRVLPWDRAWHSAWPWAPCPEVLPGDSGLAMFLRHPTHSGIGGVGFGPSTATDSHSGRRLLAVGLGTGLRLFALPADVQPPMDDDADGVGGVGESEALEVIPGTAEDGAFLF